MSAGSAPLRLWIPALLASLTAGCIADEPPDAVEAGEFRELDEGLLIHWSFDEADGNTIEDLSGNGRDGVLRSGASLVASPNGQALSLDGVDDYLTYYDSPGDPALYGGPDGSFSISARIKLADVDKYNTLCLGCGPLSTIYTGTTNYGPAAMTAFSDQDGAPGASKVWVLSEPALEADTWTQLTMTVENGTTVRYYLDCEAAGEVERPDIELHDWGFAYLGYNNNAARRFAGEIDEFRVWDRVLDDSELDQLCPAPPGLGEGLELHWSFEDSVDDEITDLSGNDRHGTLQAGATLVDSPSGQSVVLDGVDDYVALAGPRDPALYGGADGSFSISAKVLVADVNKYNTLCTGCGPLSTLYAGTEAYGPALMSALDNQGGGGKLWTLSDPLLAASAWTEVTMVVEDGASVRYYIDCALAGELDDPDLGLFDAGFSAVGFSPNAARWFGGQIDELRVWNRDLVGSEIDQLCPAPGPLDQDLELHWTFENHDGDQIIDLSGNDRHGTNLGGSFVASPNGQSLSFDGVDDRVNFVGPRAPAIYGGPDGSFSFSARVKLPDVDRYNSLSFGAGPFKSLILGHPSKGGEIIASLGPQLTTTPALGNDTWTEVTVVVEGGVGAQIYADCELLETNIFPANLSQADVTLADPNFSVLGFSNNPDRWFGGELDEMRIWSRALSAPDLDLLCGAEPQDLCDGPIHVDIDAAPGGDGLSWASAFTEVQAAIDAAAACTNPEIWVAEGTYAPDPASPVALISAPLSLYGGFAGTESELGERDIVGHPTRLGDVGWQARIVDIESSAINFVDPVRVDGLTLDGSEAGAIEVSSSGDPDNAGDVFVFLHNLTVTNNSAIDGGGLAANFWVGIDIANSHFEANVAERGAAIFNEEAGITVTNSSIVANESSDGGAVYQVSYGGLSFFGFVDFVDAVLSDNIGGAAVLAHSTSTNTSFINNSATNGAAIYARELRVELFDCTVTNNSATAKGGAIYFDQFGNAGGWLTVAGTRFEANTAAHGGAIYAESDLGDNIFVDVLDSEFDGNSATVTGGAITTANFSTELTDSVFRNNTAPRGGAYYISGPSTVSSCRFVDNEASINGGAVHATESPFSSATIINSAFVGNTAVDNGGAFFGRQDIVSSSFSANSAGNLGDAVFAPNEQFGTVMTLRDVVAWPDTIAATTLTLDHACVAAPLFNYTDVDTVVLVADPYDPADLDLDGLTELYLDPAAPCVDIGGVVDSFDWATLTTQASQCTDSDPLDAGVHYPPQSAAGPCLP